MKRRAKAIHAELRKESSTFDGWLKYEVTVEHQDGTQEQIPAYGRDLQDALSRVVHDRKVQHLVKTKMPHLTILFLTVLTISTFTTIGLSLDTLRSSVGPVIISSIIVLSTLTLSIANWFNIKSKRR
jgi:hypothetical protein